ncbi:MAG: efflux RND transporter periplasmic adaptor subunit [Deltaproteobacteria bacterium]|nr:efflux RND transporter periplasmic adaptor subunit [Deltaproteobacteria bacterium]
MSNAPDLSALRIDRNASDREENGAAWRRWLIVVVVVGLIAGAGWYFWTGDAPEVTVATVLATGGAPGSHGSGIAANGYVVARTRASVSAKIMGRLTRLDVAEGSLVRKGEILAMIEDGDFRAAVSAAQAAVKQAEAERDLAESTHKRAKELLAKSYISTTEFEQAESRARVANAQLESARANSHLASVNLESTRVRAPFDGTVLRKDAELGEVVSPAGAGGAFTRTSIVTMADLDTLEVEVDVNEAYIARIRGDQPAKISLDAYPGVEFRGRVRQVVPTADRQKATVLVKVAIDDKDSRIMPEMAAKVVFLDETPDPAAPIEPRRVTAPAAAVVTSGSATNVWVVDKDMTKSVAVKTGVKIGSEIEITSGLSGGEKVVVNPPGGLRDGQTVRVAGS